MRKEYDFSKARPNPYAKRLKRPVTIRLDEETIAYFKALADESEIPYQTLINLYLRDCAAHQRKLALSWNSARRTSKQVAEASAHVTKRGRRRAGSESDGDAD